MGLIEPEPSGVFTGRVLTVTPDDSSQHGHLFECLCLHCTSIGTVVEFIAAPDEHVSKSVSSIHSTEISSWRDPNTQLPPQSVTE